MLKIKRATEYALISIGYIGKEADLGDTEVRPITAREICEQLGLPFELTAKALQKLKAAGMIRSFQGVQGGYVLARPLSELRLGEFLRVMEGDRGLVGCCHLSWGGQSPDIDDEKDCELSSRCGIRPFMSRLNDRIFRFLSEITLDELNEDWGRMISSSSSELFTKGPSA